MYLNVELVSVCGLSIPEILVHETVLFSKWCWIYI